MVMKLSSTILVCLIICGEKFPVFYDKLEKEKNIYTEGNGRILRLVNSFLHESLLLLPIIILIILFCILKTLELGAELPQKIMPYKIIEWKWE